MPKVIEVPFMVGEAQCGVIQRYEEIEPELVLTAETPKMTRVLPAPYFYEKRLFFFLIKRYEPGETASFPNGGYEVRDEGGAKRSFDLDQIIIHPQVIKHKKTLDKMARRAEKEAKKRERQRKKGEREAKPKNTTGKRGRPALDPAEKARREAEKASRAQKSGGKRGRPKGSGEPKAPKAPKPAGTGKRGRPALSAEAIAAKVAARAQVRARSGGKRGRPKKR